MSKEWQSGHRSRWGSGDASVSNGPLGQSRVNGRRVAASCLIRAGDGGGIGGGTAVMGATPLEVEATPPSRMMSGTTTTAYGQNPNDTYQFQWKVIELDDLIPSNTDTGAINPAYDLTLQPRDRTRTASQQQIDHAAKSFVPEVALIDFHQLDKGAPIIGGDNMVESGNGRTLAMRRMRTLYPEKWQEYQTALQDHARAVGIPSEKVAQMTHPVLVRERLSQVDRAEFAREANTSAVLRMSTQETAEQDKRFLSDSALANFEVKEGQSVDDALRARGNREFVQKFTGALPETERAAVMRADGTLNRQGIWRIKAAMFARTFPGEAGSRISETFLESLDSNIRNFEAGLGGALPAMLRAEGQMSAGIRSDKLNMAEDFSKAIDMLARLRESNMSVSDYLGQASLFERELTPIQEGLLAHFDTIGRSAKKVRDFFTGYAEAVNRSDNPNQMGLFGGSGGGVQSKEDILKLLREQT